MPGPFYNAIRGSTAGTPGTGAFTPNAASSGFLAWSTVPVGWVGLARFTDGTAWELQYCYWDGTTLSRSATTQFVSSSTGSGLTLTSAATATLVPDTNLLGCDALFSPVRGYVAVASTNTTPNLFGAPTLTVQGTGGLASLAATNYLTRQIRHLSTSPTTANGQCGWTSVLPVVVASSTSNTGGWVFGARFGVSQLPTGPRWFCGLTSVTQLSTVEPSALVASYASVALDSTDTNLQILTNDGTTGGTKVNTGMPLVANSFYEILLWSNPGSLTVFYLLIRLDTGAIFYGSTATDVPTTGALMFPQMIGGLSATTGTAMIAHFGHMLFRSVS